MGQLIRSNAFTETSQKYRLQFGLARNPDGSAVVVAAAAGLFGIVSGGFGVGGTKFQGEAASGNTKTSRLKYTFTLPQNYVAASSITLKVAQRVTVIANTTANIDAEAYKSNDNGGVGSDQVTTTAQTNNTTGWVTHSFTITGTSFSPGDEVDLYLSAVVDDSGGANSSKSEVGGVYLELSTKM